VDDLPPLLPEASGARVLECRIEEVPENGVFQARVRRVTSPLDLGLVGSKLTVSVAPQTIIYWIGDDTMTVGTIMLIPLETDDRVNAGDRLVPPEIDLQNGRFDLLATEGSSGRVLEYPLKRCGLDYSQHTLRGGAKD
jgi:hypothetical protein